MAIAESVLDIVQSTARDNGASEVRCVRLRLGALSQVEPEALRFSFDVVKRGTVADSATLEFIDSPGAAWCMPCGRSVTLDRLGDGCPHCGSFQLQVTQGDELRVAEIEIG